MSLRVSAIARECHRCFRRVNYLLSDIVISARRWIQLSIHPLLGFVPGALERIHGATRLGLSTIGRDWLHKKSPEGTIHTPVANLRAYPNSGNEKTGSDDLAHLFFFSIQEPKKFWSGNGRTEEKTLKFFASEFAK